MTFYITIIDLLDEEILFEGYLNDFDDLELKEFDLEKSKLNNFLKKQNQDVSIYKKRFKIIKF